MGSSEQQPTLESHGADIGRRDHLVGQFREWLLVEGDRTMIAVLLAVLTGMLYYVLGAVGVIAFVNPDSVTRVAGGLTAGLFSLVTIVVSINQLVLSQEFTVAGSARTRLDGVTAFRHKLAETTDVAATPSSPGQILTLLAEGLRHHAERLKKSVASHEDEEIRELITQYSNQVQESADRLDETLADTEFGTFQAVSAAIRYNNGWQLHAAEHLSSQYEQSLSTETSDTFDELQRLLELFDVARESFKTTYLQRELAQLSRLTIYAGVPAILSAITLAFLYADLGGPAIEAVYLSVVTPALVGVMIFPLGLVASYVLRTATVTRRTASIGPMLPQKDPNEGPFEVSAKDGNSEQ